MIYFKEEVSSGNGQKSQRQEGLLGSQCLTPRAPPNIHSQGAEALRGWWRLQGVLRLPAMPGKR